MRISVEEMYREAIEREFVGTAHTIFYMLQKGYVKMSDDVSALSFDKLSEFERKEIEKMIEMNYLKINPIDIYTLKLDRNNFALIFARNEQEAIQYFCKVFDKKPLNCFRHMMDMEFVEGKGTITFREMRKYYSTFPALVGIYDKANKVLVS